MSAIWPSVQSNTCKTHLATTSWYFQPNSCPRRPTVQYLRPGFNRRTRRACGTTMRFWWSYGGGIPSKVFRRSMAALPRAVLCGIIPRTVRQNILDGARKWKGPVGLHQCPFSCFMAGCHKYQNWRNISSPPRVGLNRVCLRMKAWYFTVSARQPSSTLSCRLCRNWICPGGRGLDRFDVRFARKNSPEMLRASHLTTTIFWPLRSCLATVLARRPRRCPLPSMMICENNS